MVLEHDWPDRHWDFLLEAGDVLRAWRLAEEPAMGKAVPATANFAHRLMYLEYEGPVSGGRGRVRRWDGGTFEWIENGAERVAVDLRGDQLRGFAVVSNRPDGATVTLSVTAPSG